jgi:hypothetical protein
MSLKLPAGVALPVTASALVLAQQPGNGDNGGQGRTSASRPRSASWC